MVLVAIGVHSLGLLLFDNLFDLPVPLSKVLRVDFGFMSKGVVALYLLETLLPVTHLSPLVVLAHYVLQVFAMMMRFNGDVAKLLLRLDTVALVDDPDIYVNLQIYVDRILRDRKELLSLCQVALLRVRWWRCL